jgi:phosphoribosylformimino-5-aminoimidazole carboxamide ribotide isomerase
MNTVMIPAIDVRDGRVVRLQQGDYARQTTYAMDPLSLAQDYSAQGAQVLHMVDLDAARLGGFSLYTLMNAIQRSTKLRLQAGGGIRSREQIVALFEAGAERVVIGTLALTEKAKVQSWLQEFGAEAITLAFDVKTDARGIWRCASHGWTALESDSLDETIAFYQSSGLKHLLCTDIARDGLLGGYNLGLYQHLQLRWPDLALQASGGVSQIADIRAIKAMGVSGAILGRALLEGRFSLSEALSC